MKYNLLKKGSGFLFWVVLSGLFLLPIILTITNSFMTSSEIQSNYGSIFSIYGEEGYQTYTEEKVNLKWIPDWVTGKQYKEVLFQNPEYLMKLWNSVILVVPIVVVQVIVALGAAYSFARVRTKRRQVLFLSYILWMIMPYQVTLVPNYLVSGWLHILNTRIAVILPGIFAPFCVYLLTKYMRRIPKEVMEAARLDGAGEWKILTRVCIPMIRGPVISVIILTFIDNWNMVEQPLVLLNDAEKYPLSIFLSQMKDADAGVAFAASVIYMIPPLLLFLYGQEDLVQQS